MRKFRVFLTILMITFLVGIGATCAMPGILSPKQEPLVLIPDAPWVPIFFESTGLASKSISERTKESNLPNLRAILLPGDDLEARVWIGFGLQGVDGLIVRRFSHQWSAIYLQGMAERPPFPNYQSSVGPPKSGWEAAWQRLSDAQIVTLPDASTLECGSEGTDGTSYVVEINMKRTYRTYRYPDHGKCDEARQMIKIGEIIADEFGLDNFRIISSSPR